MDGPFWGFCTGFLFKLSCFPRGLVKSLFLAENICLCFVFCYNLMSGGWKKGGWLLNLTDFKTSCGSTFKKRFGILSDTQGAYRTPNLFLKPLRAFWNQSNTCPALHLRTNSQNTNTFISAIESDLKPPGKHWMFEFVIRCKMCYRKHPSPDFTFSQLFRVPTFSTFSAGSKGIGPFTDGCSCRSGYLFEASWRGRLCK